jgi:hypothetical protein
MTTSGSIDYSVSRDDIITEALMHMGVLPEGGTPNASQVSDATRTLQIMIKRWMGRGINLWAITNATVFLQQSKSAYVTGTDHITLTSNVVRTTLASAAASSASTIVVSSATGILTTYNIGVLLDSGTMLWTTVNGAPSGTTVTLTTALTGAAAAGNQVYVYSAKITANSMKSVLEVTRRDKNLIGVPITLITRNQYVQLGNPTGDGPVVQVQYQPNLASSTITTYPESSNETDVLELVFKRAFEDFDASGNTPDFPQEWYEALYLGLAYRLSRPYRLPLAERKLLHDEAEEALQEVEGWDREQNTSIFLMPTSWGK